MECMYGVPQSNETSNSMEQEEKVAPTEHQHNKKVLTLQAFSHTTS